MGRHKKIKQNKSVGQNSATEKIFFDIKKLLKTEKYDSKPNMAKFLKTYVESIRICIKEAKVNLWPKISYDIGKIIIHFKDSQSLIKDINGIYLFREYDDISLTESNIETINKFLDYLEQFRFIRNGHEDVKVFSTDIEKTNAELSAQINCVKEKEIQQFIDYTPKILVK